MKLGVIGGLGPLATACFLEMVTEMTDASRDQDHLEMIIYSVPWIPDRTDYILGRSQDSPIDPMIEIGRKLAGEQVSCIAIPCMTAHYFYRELSERIPVPIVHGIYETGMEIQKNHIEKVGLMATDGTIRSRIFQDQLENMGLITSGSTKIEMNADASAIVDELGDPDDYFESESCAFEGLDKVYTYPGFHLNTYPVDDKDYVLSVDFMDDTVETDEGISIGSTKDEVTEAYGEPAEETSSSLVYEKGDTEMTIGLDGDSVSSLEISAVTEE